MAKYDQRKWVSAPLAQDKDLREFAASIQENLKEIWEHLHDHEAIGADISVGAADRVVVSDSEGVIGASTITSTELQWLSGVTSAIQAQLNSKQPIGSYLTGLTGDVSATGPGNATATLANTTVTPGSYTNTNLTVDAKGRVTAASNGAASHNPVTIATPANGLAVDGGQEVSLATASGSTTGALTSTDWTTFNNKLSTAVTSIAKNGDTPLTGAVTLTGGTNITLTQTGNDISFSAAGAPHDAVTIGTANGLSLSGQQLSLAAADGSNAGALTAGTQTIGGAKTFSSPVTVQGTGAAPQMVVFDAPTNSQKSAMWMQTVANNGGINISANLSAVDTYYNTGQGASRLSMQSANSFGGVIISASSVNNAALTNAATFSDTGSAIKGTTTNDNAPTGFVGQYVVSSVSSNTLFPATDIWGDLTSMSLTAGDWDISLLATYNNVSPTGNTTIGFAISTVSGNSSSGMVQTLNLAYAYQISNITMKVPIVIPAYRLSLASTTTVYLKYYSVYTGGTHYAIGTIRARRVR